MQILDAVVFISDMSIEEESYTVNEVLEELKSKNAKLRAFLAISQGNLKIKEPCKKNVEKVIKTAKKTGDLAGLSLTDIKLLALAMELGGVLITDDYAIQNVAEVLNVKYMRLIEKGIKKIIEWKNICKGCGKMFPIEYKDKCDVCGSELRKVAKKIRKAKKWKT